MCVNVCNKPTERRGEGKLTGHEDEGQVKGRRGRQLGDVYKKLLVFDPDELKMKAKLNESSVQRNQLPGT